MKRVKNILIPCVVLLCLASSAWAQGSVSSYDARFAIQYPVGQTTIDPKHANNYYAMEELKRFFHMVDIARVDSIVVIGSSSPEGEGRRNFALAYERAESLQSFICAEFPYVSRNMMHLYAKGDTWSDMLRAISRDPQFPNKDHTLIVLGADQAYTERLKLLKFLEYKDAHSYLTRVTFPRLRNATAFVIYYKSEEPFVVYDTPEEFEKRPQVIGAPVNAPALFVAPALQEAAPTIKADTLQPSSSWTVEPRVKRPLFALKTNLLFDALTLANIGIEVPIGDQFSVGVEVIFPWWLNEKKQNSLQLFNANIEGKYWFNPKPHKRGLFPVMTGWFAGLYFGGGYYDLEYQGKGYQGESFISVGIMGGFAHSIGKSLRLEYSLGVGYMQTQYRQYEARLMSNDQWNLVRRNTSVFEWYGPTQIKISLVWLLNKNYAKKGGVR